MGSPKDSSLSDGRTGDALRSCYRSAASGAAADGAAHNILDCTVAPLSINNNLRDKTSLYRNIVAANNRSGAMCWDRRCGLQGPLVAPRASGCRWHGI